ncbi:MAG TPA: GGDEF domain-containing protein [Steroidobacteraceae bacterium]|nr:GGDEF domain-containing protein [Gammaproteobacteria bacterium]HEV2285064.1 GGDEF domain-containing protein [Steroidobacteraceae bacterium]
MRYSENKDQSAELLRLALPLMARQSAALHPISYTLWYEHVAGINPPLSAVLEASLAGKLPLGEDDVYDLHARFVVARDMEVLERLQHKLRQVLEEAAQTAAVALEDSGQFEAALRDTRSRLTGAVSLETVHAIIAELARETNRMQSATEAVHQRLESRAREVEVLTRQLEQAKSEALLDPLTGLKNRRGFEVAVSELGRAAFKDAALVLADIDHFKEINDKHGHLLGDKILRAIGATLQSNIKGRDIAARPGGDEFAILLQQTPLAGARALAEQIRAAVAAGRIRRADSKEQPGSVTLSIGVAVGGAEDTLESMLARADAALYAAKRAGRNRVSVDSGEPVTVAATAIR